MMQKIDAEHMDHPAKGVVVGMTDFLLEAGYKVGVGRVRRLHNSLDALYCIDVFQNAIATYGTPKIINSDQGCQFTCKAWIDACAQHSQMMVSMDGRGRARDNIWIERF